MHDGSGVEDGKSKHVYDQLLDYDQLFRAIFRYIMAQLRGNQVARKKQKRKFDLPKKLYPLQAKQVLDRT